MSRKSKIVLLEKKEVEIKELTIQDILDLFSLDSKFELDDFKKIFKKFLPRVSNITFNDLLDLAPSELNELYEAFKEVNADFINAFKSLGVGNHLAMIGSDLRKAIEADLNAVSSGSSREGT